MALGFSSFFTTEHSASSTSRLAVVRLNAHCAVKGCKHRTSQLAIRIRRTTRSQVWNRTETRVVELFFDGQGVRLDFDKLATRCPEHGRTLRPRPVDGRVREDVRCGALCFHAKGHDCECSCGGLNHGKGG